MAVAGLLAGALIPSAVADGDPQDDGRPDLLRFTNGDALHGAFRGLENGPRLQWTHPGARDPIVLDTKTLRRLAFNNGRARASLVDPSHVVLSNGDRIPGRILELDAKHLTVETRFAGTLAIPRQHVQLAAPNPHGGELLVLGPLNPKDWRILEPTEPDGSASSENDEHPPEDDHKPVDSDPPWVFSGVALYSNVQQSVAADVQTPDMARFRFDLAWRNRLSAQIAFHATLEPPPPAPPGDENGRNDKPRPGNAPRGQSSQMTADAMLYGPCYILTVTSGYIQLLRCTFDDDANPIVSRLNAFRPNLQLKDTGKAAFDLRCNRSEHAVALFVNGHFVTRWTDPDGYAGTGTHLAFACRSSSASLRLSDLVVTSWNGMIDSASSMQAEDRDVVLLVNGTDRYSGNLEHIENGLAHFRGSYADMHIPLDVIQEIRFARDQTSDPPEPARDAIRLALMPRGRLTVTPAQSDRSVLKARHHALGPLNLDLRYARLIEFSFSDSILDLWDEDF